ncbi:hypothetical protein BBP40_010729 [Aspergillus hancockii]|nr:hypothetical protein BBP40_010729 [Aspergillus hancockii]
MCTSPYAGSVRRCVTRYNALAPSPWGEVEALDEYIEDGRDVVGTMYVTGSYMRTSPICGRNAFFLKTPRGSRIQLCCEVADLQDDYWEAVRSLHVMGYYPQSLYDLLNPSTIGQLSNLSPRAWDAPAPTAPTYVYTSKVDGQRMWILVYGRLCYYVSRLGKRSISGWWMCEGSAGRRDIPLVLDVEFVANGAAALIDVLVDIHGTVAPVSRDMKWVADSWSEARAAIPDIPVYMRRYFSDVGAAVDYAAAEGNPYDGVIGVSVKSTEAIKVKEIRSMELQLKDGTLLTADGDAILKPSDVSRFADGDILEVRFSAGTGGRRIRVREIFRRSDKTQANGTAACRDIITCALRGVDNPGDIQRRVAVTWCQELTCKLLESAWSTKRSGNIILDLGSGDGQSIDNFKSRSDMAYILVEPDEGKCEKLARRAGARKVHTDPMTLIPVIQSLHKGSQKFAVARMAALDVLKCDELMKHLRPRVRCATATFSAQFCIPAFELCVDYGLPFVGCCYLYDGVRVGEYLLDVSGVTMVKTGGNVASVKWGGDVTYVEPALNTRDFSGVSRVFKASSLKKLPEAEADPDASAICSKIYVVTSI